MPGDNSSSILGNLTSPTAVKAAMAECDRLGREAFLLEYGFKPAMDYVVRSGASEYDSKAIGAVAFGYQYGTRPLAWEECRGGRAQGRAGWALDRLGFDVAGIKHNGWWLDEVERSIDSYFEMFALHCAGKQFKKSEFLKRLHQDGPNRSYKAYEYKLQNISAVLQDLRRKWLPGYAPKNRYQQLLRFAVEDRLGRSPHQLKIGKLPKLAEPGAPRLVKIDWAKRDAENRALGNGGEKYVFERERHQLIGADKPELAARVKWNASEADGHGYDISSFEIDGTPIFIEVKTTTRGKETPFFVSSNEVMVSNRLGNSYRLYRVYNFLSSPSISVFSGSLEDYLLLSPISYRAKPI